MKINLQTPSQMSAAGIAPFTQSVLQSNVWQPDGQSLWSVLNTMGVSTDPYSNADAIVSEQEMQAVVSSILTANPGLWDGSGYPILSNQVANTATATQAAIDSGAISVHPLYTIPSSVPGGAPVPVAALPIVNSVVVTAHAPSQTPGSAGSVPSGRTTGLAIPKNTVFRFILYSPGSVPGANTVGYVPGDYMTGANITGCNQNNPAACDPQSFLNLSDAVAYARSRGETPYTVSSLEEVWEIVNGTVNPNPAQVPTASHAATSDLLSNPLVWAAGALMLFKVL